MHAKDTPRILWHAPALAAYAETYCDRRGDSPADHDAFDEYPQGEAYDA